jgi:cytochrome c biogenesis protein CcmG, thiol:disulfide interchange protein DsbE
MRTYVNVVVLALALLLAAGSAAAQRPGEAFPEIALLDQHGVPFASDELAGRAWMINVWASWCPPCRAELPLLARAAADLEQQGVGLLLINATETASVAQAFLEREGLELRTLVDPDTPVAGLERTIQTLDRLRARGLPSTYFVDADGILRSVYVGELLEDVLAEQLERAFGVSWQP